MHRGQHGAEDAVENHVVIYRLELLHGKSEADASLYQMRNG